MALEHLGDRYTASLTGLTSANVGEAVRLISDGSDNPPRRTVGRIDATNKKVNGKLLSVADGADAFNITSVNVTTGQITRPSLGTVATGDVLAFTNYNSSGVVTPLTDADVGKGIEGVGDGQVGVAASGGTGEIVDYSGSTMYVDMNGTP